MKKQLLQLLIIVFVMASLQSCKKEVSEHIADDSTFADFKSWTLKATKNGIDPSLGAAHGGNDANTVRTIYFKDNASKDDEEFPVGTVINKLSHNDTTGLDMRTGMVKRGNDFDKESGDWEYFILMPDGEIAKDPTTGEALRGNSGFKSCGGCHAGAKSKDYIFTE